MTAMFNFVLLAVLLGLSRLTSASPLEPRATTLKSAAASRWFGAALAVAHLSDDSTFKSLASSQFSAATPENEMKWDATEPNQNQFTFTDGDTIAAFASANGQKLRGHTLVWNNQLPSWVTSLTGANLLSAMNNHITTVMTHYKGKAYCWDVVNEAFNDDGSYRTDVFYTQLGSSYITTAFQTARAADPNAKLYINDYNTEGENAKSDALYNVVQALKSSNLIDGVGFQCHFIVGEVPSDLQTNLQRFASLGVDVWLTELDIRMPTPATAANLAQQATDYATVANACQAVSRCVGITTWGITDEYSWVPSSFPGQGAALLWDDNYNTKPAYTSTINALST